MPTAAPPANLAPAPAATADRLRNRIDAGQTGDKIAGTDPAASPLGTDDEAGAGPDAAGLAAARAAPPPPTKTPG